MCMLLDQIVIQRANVKDCSNKRKNWHSCGQAIAVHYLSQPLRSGCVDLIPH